MNTSRTIKLNKSQRAAAIRVINRLREQESYNGVTSVRIESLTDCEYFVSLVLSTRRSDCERNSHRQILNGKRLHAFIGPRGGLTVVNYESGLSSVEDNEALKRLVASTLRAQVQ